MGVDAVIYVKAKTDSLDLALPSGYELVPAPAWSKEEEYESAWKPNGATHSVDTVSRYYGPGYERGHWPAICAVLMELLACSNVECVWYGGDTGEKTPLCPPERVLEISAHYMANGNRPYYQAFERKA